MLQVHKGMLAPTALSPVAQPAHAACAGEGEGGSLGC